MSKGGRKNKGIAFSSLCHLSIAKFSANFAIPEECSQVFVCVMVYF